MLITDCPCVLFALDRECAPFRRLFPTERKVAGAPYRAWLCTRNARTVLVIETGVGAVRTQRALDWLRTSAWPVQYVIASGFAGSLTNKVYVGDVLVASEVVDPDGNAWPTGWKSPTESASPLVSGRLLSSPRMIGDAREKNEAGQKYRAEAVDMESATVARFCATHGVPFGCVRSISDDVDTTLSPHLVSLLGGGQVSMGRLVLTLIRHPGLVVPLVKLARDTSLASRALAGRLLELIAE